MRITELLSRTIFSSKIIFPNSSISDSPNDLVQGQSTQPGIQNQKPAIRIEGQPSRPVPARSLGIIEKKNPVKIIRR